MGRKRNTIRHRAEKFRYNTVGGGLFVFLNSRPRENFFAEKSPKKVVLDIQLGQLYNQCIEIQKDCI